jgi:hypothetical protein
MFGFKWIIYEKIICIVYSFFVFVSNKLGLNTAFLFKKGLNSKQRMLLFCYLIMTIL